MSRVLAVVACGVTLAACSASLPSLDMFKGSPPSEQLRIESEPPGADARTSQGQSCRTPCELTVPSNTDFTVTVALNGYQSQTIPVIPETPPPDRQFESGPTPHLQPNPVYVELQPAGPARKQRAPAKKKTSSTSSPAPTQAVAPSARTPNPASDYPWPSPQ